MRQRSWQKAISNNGEGFDMRLGGVIKSFGNNFITDTSNGGTLTPIAQR
jgi:hypothetical protein